MNKYPFLTLAIAIFIINPLSAQKYKDFVFVPADQIEVPESLKEMDEAVIDKTLSVEVIIDGQAEIQYEFFRTLKIVNSVDQISANNKIYLSANKNSEYLFQKARVISPKGDVKLLDEDDIKKGIYENDDGSEQEYYYYALEGLEKGSIIEEVSYKKMGAQYYGEIYYLQGGEYREHQLFELISPGHLGFEFETLNEEAEVLLDTTTGEDINRWYIELNQVEKILDQPYLYSSVVKKGVLYKLDKNVAQNRSDITNFSRVNDFIDNRSHPEIDKKSQKWLDGVAKDLKLKGKTDLEIILAIENYIKTEFNIVEYDNPQFEDIASVIDSKVANKWGSTNMMINLLEKMGIKYQIVLTTDRTETRFPKNFEAFMFLREVLLYFPSEDLYIAPSDKFGRGKYIPPSWRNNYGYFLKKVEVGTLITLIGQVQFIEPLGYMDNADIMQIEVDFTANIKKPVIRFSKKQTGQVAKSLQPYINLMDAVVLEQFKSNITDMVNEEIESDDVELVNVEKEDFGTKPFEIKFTTENHRFVETAGNDVLFKVGELIGPQMEMYQEEERQFPLENEFKRYYKRNIKLILPDNYSLNNTEALNFSKSYAENGDTLMLFTSSITQKGNTYEIESIEYYDRIIYPKSLYDSFVEVINAAADFNKIVLILKEKE